MELCVVFIYTIFIMIHKRKTYITWRYCYNTRQGTDSSIKDMQYNRFSFLKEWGIDEYFTVFYIFAWLLVLSDTQLKGTQRENRIKKNQYFNLTYSYPIWKTVFPILMLWISYNNILLIAKAYRIQKKTTSIWYDISFTFKKL